MSYYNTSAGSPQQVRYNTPQPVTAGADARNGKLAQVQVTLTTAGTVYTVTLPASARGFKLYPSVADVIFAVGEAPVALATITGTTVANDFGIGNTARLAVETVRILDDGTAAAGAVLQLRSATNSAVVVVETF